MPTNLMGNVRKERLTVCFDSATISLLKVLNAESGLSMSQFIERLVRIGLNNSRFDMFEGEEIKQCQ